MTDITITKVNESWIKVECAEVYQELDIQDRFSFTIPNAKHDPRVKKGVWDGIKKLYNRRTRKLYLGLLFELLSFCDQKGWSYYLDPKLMPSEDMLTEEELLDIIKQFNPVNGDGDPIDVYDYQLEAVLYQLNMDRTVSLAATSAGKSLMMYLSARIYQLMDEFVGKKIFIAVPSINLVEQLYGDFAEYSAADDSWHVNQYCQRVTAKYPKSVDKQIVITTWQSMAKMPHSVLDEAGAIFVDECHTAKADVLASILEAATSCPIRHGLTGTLDGVECNELVIQGHLGPAKRIVTAKEIIDAGRASDVHISMTMLNYSQEIKERYYEELKTVPYKERYRKEIEYINNLECRKNFVFDFLDTLEGNTLILFDLVESYGNLMYEEYCSRQPDSTFLITGQVDGDERDKIRTGMEQHSNAKIFASFGTMSTGISIKKLHNLVIISSSKSKIRILQSIGRLMRLHSTKNKAYIIDLVDNFILNNNDKPNYVLDHAQERLKFYNQEQFKIKFEQINLS